MKTLVACLLIEEQRTKEVKSKKVQNSLKVLREEGKEESKVLGLLLMLRFLAFFSVICFTRALTN